MAVMKKLTERNYFIALSTKTSLSY